MALLPAQLPRYYRRREWRAVNSIISGLAAFSYKQKAPAIFAVPVWEDDRIGIRIKPLPDPLHATEIGQFLEDWRVAYLSHVEEILRDAPENLRFSGGLWRDVR